MGLCEIAHATATRASIVLEAYRLLDDYGHVLGRKSVIARLALDNGDVSTFFSCIRPLAHDFKQAGAVAYWPVVEAIGLYLDAITAPTPARRGDLFC